MASATVPCTEIALLELTPGADPSDASNPAVTILQDALKTISEQPGYQRMAWGIAEEAQNLLVLQIDWDNLEAHQAFIKASHYQPFLTNLGKVLTGAPTLFHVVLLDWSPPATSAMSKWDAPVVECFFSYYPADKATPELQKEVGDARNKFLTALTKTSDTTVRSFGNGWALEDEIVVDGNKVKPYALLIGWDSIDAHTKARDTQFFKDHAHLIRDGKYEKAVVYHVKFNRV